MISPFPHDYLPMSSSWGTVSYTEDLIELARRAPDGSTMVARGGQHDQPSARGASSLTIRSRSGSWTAYRTDAWGDLDPYDVEEGTAEIRRHFNLSWNQCASIGRMAGALLQAFTAMPAPEHRLPDLADYSRACYQLPAACDPSRTHAYWLAHRSIRGGLIRAFGTVRRDATLIDLRAAYLWAMRSVPVGQPGFYWGNGVKYESIQRAECPAIVSVPVRTRAPAFLPQARAWGSAYPVGDWVYEGWSAELDIAIQAGAAELIGPVRWALYWARTGDPIGELLERMEGSLPSPIFKSLYRAIWTRFTPGGCWRGVLQCDPPRSAWPVKADPFVDGLWWTWTPPQPPGYRIVSRPEITSWVTSIIRARMAGYCARLDPVVSMVDALVVDTQRRAEWTPLLGERPGTFSVRGSGVYLGAGPGQYAILDDAGQISRFRLSGIERSRAGWKELSGAARALAREVHRSEGRYPVVPVRVRIPGQDADWVGKWPDLDLRQSEVGWYQLDGANMRRMTAGGQ